MADPDTPMGGLDGPATQVYVPPPSDFPDEANWEEPTYVSSPGEDYRKEKWIKSERNWKNHVGKGWVARRVLGQGGFGVVGHWEYQGPDRAMKPLKDVAVKQASVMRKSRRANVMTRTEGLEKEAKFLMLFAQRRTQHIVKMYRRLYTDTGSGANSVTADPATEVHRIFLEYCPGGDLLKFANDPKKRSPDANQTRELSELELWMIFHCLARAVLVMHQGSEDADPSAVRWDQQEILHFDLKPDNVLVGEKATDAEHFDAPVFKIADFGISKFVPKVQDFPYLNSRSWGGGTDAWNLPEQFPNSQFPAQFDGNRPWQKKTGTRVKDRRFGTASNVWQIGIIMHCLLNRKEWPQWDKMRLYNSAMSVSLMGKEGTLGYREDIEIEAQYIPELDFEGKPQPKPKYSKWLRGLIAETLLVNPKDRREVKSLVLATKEGLEITRTITNAQDIAMPDITSYDEPMLDPAWYSGQTDHEYYAAAMAVKAAKEKAGADAPDILTLRRARVAALEASQPHPANMNPDSPYGPDPAPGQGGPLAMNPIFPQIPINNAPPPGQGRLKPLFPQTPVYNPPPEVPVTTIFSPIAPNTRFADFKARKAASRLAPPSDTKPIDVIFIIERKAGIFGGIQPAENYTMKGISPLMRISEVRLNLARRWGIPVGKLVIRAVGREAGNAEYIGTVTGRSRVVRCKEMP